MITIKFRAWDKENKIMWEVDCLNWYDEYMWVNESPMTGNKLLIENTPLMQFTGLKDKNGKEIYEGDILYDAMLNEQSVVSWDDSGCWKIGKVYSCNISLGNDEVIGNIYENPELLKPTEGEEKKK